MRIKKIGKAPNSGTVEAASAVASFDTSKEALYLCLERIKAAKSESDLRRLTEELQRIVFHRQYRNAEN